MKEIDEAARDFVQLFERLDVPYALMGGFAVRAYAFPRPTFDVNFTLAIARERLNEFYDLAEELGYSISPAQRQGWIDHVQEFPLIKFKLFIAGHSVDIDVFLAETPFQRELLQRRRQHEIDGWQAFFVSPEDLILLKLTADRHKDRAAAADILFYVGQLDEDYLRDWAAKLGIADRLERALAEVE